MNDSVCIQHREAVTTSLKVGEVFDTLIFIFVGHRRDHTRREVRK